MLQFNDNSFTEIMIYNKPVEYTVTTYNTPVYWSEPSCAIAQFHKQYPGQPCCLVCFCPKCTPHC